MRKTRRQRIFQLRRKLAEKPFDEYEIRSGDAGFMLLFKNGQRIQPHNISMKFKKRRLYNVKAR